jgi:thiamine monophosphate kinase
MNERDLVARAKELFSNRIGGDAAVVGDQVLTTDMLVEDVDFTRAIPIRFIARKSLAVNLSDLAAMGAQPQYPLLALALPPWVDAEELFSAYAEAATEQGIEIVGGDLSRGDKLTISVTAIGKVITRPLAGTRRRGATDPRTAYVAGAPFATLATSARCPVLLVRGESDPMVTLEQLRRHCGAALEIPGTGHNAHVESPASIVALCARLPSEAR